MGDRRGIRAGRIAASAITLSIACAIGLGAPTALAAQATVSGQVRHGHGMTLVALAPDGSGTRVKLGGKGTFKLRLRSARDVTLQLLRADGRYFGPVLLASHRRTGYEALAGRAVRLGQIALGRGFARTRKAAPAKALDRARTVLLDRNGAPLGAMRHGVVAMRSHARLGLRGAAESAQSPDPGADPDHDGIPSALDLDANGNGRLDNFDPAAPSAGDGFFSGLYTDMRAALNLDATPGISRTTIDRVIAGDYAFNLDFWFDEGRFRGGDLPTGAHVDCGGLTYCRRGDASAVMGGFADAQGLVPSGERWSAYTPDGAGSRTSCVSRTTGEPGPWRSRRTRPQRRSTPATHTTSSSTCPRARSTCRPP